MASWRENFLKMPVDARHRYAKYIAKKGRITTHFIAMIPEYMIPRHSRLEMMEWVKRHSVTNEVELEKAILLHLDENPPTVRQIKWMFGTMEQFFRQVYPKPELSIWGRELTDESVAQCCARLKVRNKLDYIQLKSRQNFSWLPETEAIESRFGSWRLFQQLILTYDIDLHFGEYFKQSMKKGAPLTLHECDRKGIELNYLHEVLGERLFKQLLRKQKELLKENLKPKELKDENNV